MGVAGEKEVPPTLTGEGYWAVRLAGEIRCIGVSFLVHATSPWKDMVSDSSKLTSP